MNVKELLSKMLEKEGASASASHLTQGGAVLSQGVASRQNGAVEKRALVDAVVAAEMRAGALIPLAVEREIDGAWDNLAALEVACAGAVRMLEAYGAERSARGVPAEVFEEAG